MRIPVTLMVLALSLGAGPLAAEQDRSGFAIQVFGGFTANIPTALEIDQAGEPPLDFEAEWETRPFEQPLYWAVRARWRRPDDGFELQLLHHKMILGNLQPEVTHFEVTHGFNVLTAHYVKTWGWLDARLGAGFVLPHTDNEVRGRWYAADGYTLQGPALVAGVGSERIVADHLILAAEIQFIAGWATVTVANGRADVTSLAFHFLFGAGYRF